MHLRKNILAFNKAAAIQIGEISAITTATIEYGLNSIRGCR